MEKTTGWKKIGFSPTDVSGGAQVRLAGEVHKAHLTLTLNRAPNLSEAAVFSTGVSSKTSKRSDGGADVFFSPDAAMVFSKIAAKYGATDCPEPNWRSLDAIAVDHARWK